MKDTTLGSILSGTEHRDAIHIAVAPMRASETLSPGQRVGFIGSDQSLAGPSDKVIGIVDPFLPTNVEQGQWFYMLLMPRTVTSLRHHWSHPEFEDLPEHSAEVAWVSVFAARWKYSFDEFMDGARQYIQKDYELDDRWEQADVEDGDWDTFWTHFHTLTGMSVGDKDKGFVRCCPN